MLQKRTSKWPRGKRRREDRSLCRFEVEHFVCQVSKEMANLLEQPFSKQKKVRSESQID